MLNIRKIPRLSCPEEKLFLDAASHDSVYILKSHIIMMSFDLGGVVDPMALRGYS